jgi:hypothetical protein
MNSSKSISSSESVTSPKQVSGVRSWIFSGLVLAVSGLFLWTWFQPWWVAYIEELQQNGVIIYPHAMMISGTLRDYPQWIIGAEMPVWFFPMTWIIMGLLLLALLMSLFFTEEWVAVGRLDVPVASALIGSAGLAYVLYVIVFVIVVAIRAPQFNGVPLQGNVFISVNPHTESYVITSLQLGYWLACTVGPLLVALAVLRNRIIGKS